MKKITRLLLSLLFLTFIINDQTAFSASNTPPQTVRLGVYLHDIYDINMLEDSFKSAFWIWFLYQNKNLNPAEHMTISNAKDPQPDYSSKPKLIGNYYRSLVKYRATIHQHWDLTKFPFDTQRLTIILKNADQFANPIQYTVDNADSQISSDLKLRAWKLLDFNVNVEPTPSTSAPQKVSHLTSVSSASPEEQAITINIVLKRKSLRAFFKIFGVSFLAILLSFATFFFPVKQLNLRIRFLLGAIFAAFANKYWVDFHLPPADKITLVDHIQLITLTYLAFAIAITLMITALNRKGYNPLGIVLNKLSAFLSFIIVPSLNVYFIYQALH